jgi:hypothetical protein
LLAAFLVCLILCSACGARSAQPANAEATTGAEPTAAPGSDEMVCERVREPGRLTGKRVCTRKSDDRAERDSTQNRIRQTTPEPPPPPEMGGSGY